MFVTGQGGQIEVLKLKHEDGKKMPAAQFCAETGLAVGTILGT
jgi:methionyl-tRNA formyltransferase